MMNVKNENEWTVLYKNMDETHKYIKRKISHEEYTVTGSFYMKSKSDKPICDRRQESSN